MKERHKLTSMEILEKFGADPGRLLTPSEGDEPEGGEQQSPTRSVNARSQNERNIDTGTPPISAGVLSESYEQQLQVSSANSSSHNGRGRNLGMPPTNASMTQINDMQLSAYGDLQQTDFSALLTRMSAFSNSILGNQRADSTVKQYRVHLNVLFEQAKSLKNTLDYRVMNFTFQKLRDAGKINHTTCQSYIGSARKLVEYMKLMESDLLNTCGIDVPMVEKGLSALFSSLKRPVRKEAWQRKKRDLERIPSGKHLCS